MTAKAMGMTDAAGRAASAGNGTGPAGPAPLAPATVRALEAAGLDVSDVVRVVRAALDEDFRYGPDVTSAATVAGRRVTAEVVAREAGVAAGLPVALAVFALLADYERQRVADGEPGRSEIEDNIVAMIVGLLTEPVAPR